MKMDSTLIVTKPSLLKKSGIRSGRLLIVLALGLALMLALFAGLQITEAAQPLNLFAKPDGLGIACSRISPCNLQTALAQASNGDSIYAARGKYTGKGTDVISVTKSITLYGGWDGAVVGSIVRDPVKYESILSGEGQRRVVRISGNITPTLDGFTIANGNATGLIVDCDDLAADGCGGGIFIHNAHPIVTNNIITNNVAAMTTLGYPTGTTGYGGGIYLGYAARAVINGNLIISNAASLANCGAGGGIYLYKYGDISGTQVQFNRVYNNTATSTNLGCAWGGGINGGPDGVRIRGNTINSNRANGYGGGLGAGLYQWYGSAAYQNNSVMGNRGNVSGQAVYLGYSQSRFEGNLVMDNDTTQGIQLLISEGNGATLVNNVVARSGNQTLAAIGYAGAQLTATLLHNTLIGSGSGSGVYVGTGYVTLYMTNTIIVSHTWGITNSVPASSSVLANHTLFWANSHDGLRGVSPVDGSPAIAADGYHLRLGSAAIDAGVNAGVLTDIDGNPRPDGAGYDIGADELQLRRSYLPLVLQNY